MKTFFDILVQDKKENKKYFDRSLYYSKKIKAIARHFLKEVRVFLFGSVVKQKAGPNSDIDLLIVSPNVTRKLDMKIRVAIIKKIGSGTPFEIHIVKPEVYEGWYKNFIKKDYIVV